MLNDIYRVSEWTSDNAYANVKKEGCLQPKTYLVKNQNFLFIWFFFVWRKLVGRIRFGNHRTKICGKNQQLFDKHPRQNVKLVLIEIKFKWTTISGTA